MRSPNMMTSAIALMVGCFPAIAQSAEWDVRVGGYVEENVALGFWDIDGFSGDQFDGVDNKTDSEIWFLPSIELENGLKIGANIQLEASSNGDQIDEAFLEIKGSFGELILGSENSAGYKMTLAAPNVSHVAINSASTTAFLPFNDVLTNDNNGDGDTLDAGENVNVGDGLFRQTLGTTFLENGGNNDAQRFTYFSPRFSGVRLGLSYARDGLQDNNAQVNLNGNALAHIFDVGVDFRETFAGVSVAAAGRWGIAEDDSVGATNNPQVFGGSMRLGFGGFQVGGGFAEQNNSGNRDGRSFDAGIAYRTGPWGFSFTYLNGENVDDENEFNALGNDESRDSFLAAVNYNLAKGVRLGIFGIYENFDEDTGDALGNRAATGDDVDGFVIGTGIALNF